MNTKEHGHGLHLLLLILAVALIGVVYVWQHNKVIDATSHAANVSTELKEQKAQAADREKTLSSLPNTVIDSASSSTDLVAFLGSNNSQCYKDNGNKGYYKVVKNVNNEFAKMQYGCEASQGSPPSGDPAYILAKKTKGAWALINPTNQWLVVNNQAVPSCKMINDSKVSKLLEAQCYTQSGTEAGKIRLEPVTNP